MNQRNLRLTLAALITVQAAFGQGKQETKKNIDVMRTETIQRSKISETLYFNTSDGSRIAYRLDGAADKPVLVLSNSIATDMHMWDGQLPAFTKYFRVLRFDTRGNGVSSSPEGDYTLERMSLDILELLDSLHMDRVHFLGLSLGGFIGQWLGIHAPNRINKLILANTSPHLGPVEYFNDKISTLRSGGSMEPFANMFITNWFPKNYDPAIVAKFRAMVLATSPRGLAGSFAAVRDADLRSSLSSIKNKTLIIGGTHDGVTLPEHSELMAKSIPNSTIVLLPVVHLSNVESREVFEKTVLDFLLEAPSSAH